ncbi:MAG: autotransporter domain-containing protein, partial [Alphaproteobacteria bacterium]|nr:autotransporter domain-containing protein [Alphaproteobacteria bacterium]
FINNNTNEGWLGGAIAVEYAPDGLIIDEGATFTDNSAKTDGGAIAVWTSENENISDKKITGVILGKGATFTGNTATNRGGAVYNAAMAEIAGATFTTNEAATGGAIYNGDPDKRGNNSGTLSIKDSTFTENKAEQGGAILSGTSATNLTIANTTFTGNEAVLGGGAVWSGAVTNITGSTFDGNKITGTSYNDDMNDGDSEGGAAVFVGSSSKTTVSGSTFKNNESGTVGGAIATRSNSDGTKSSLTIENTTFENNSAAISGGAINIASAKENVTLKGANTFSGNKAGDDLNDIHNAGSITVAEGSTLTLDGGISGEGTTAFAADTTLNLKDSTVIANTVTSEGTTLNVSLSKDTKEVDLAKIFAKDNGSVDNMKLNTSNGLYKFATEDEVLYMVTQKNASEVASGLGVSGSAAAAVLAAVSDTETTNKAFNSVAATLNEAAQANDKVSVAEAEKLGADAAPVARAVETSRTNMIFAAVNDELNGAANAMAEGMSAGDYFRKAKAWIRGLFNYADHDGTSKAQGFDADTYGVAMGIDKELDNHVKAGFGYAYSQTDVNGDVRDTDIDTNTLFVYGQYKPADWYINTALAYSWSDYDEKKSVLGHNADAKYDVDTIALQAMYGFERKLGAYDLNPEFGFRYMHISQDGYTDNLGSKVNSKDSDVLTAVAGTKIAKSYELENGMVLRPELKAAVTYDVISDDNNANVMLANGAGYRVNGEKLERLGFEFGAKVATDVSDNWEVAAGYELRLRKDYNDNTLMLNAKYNF